MGVVSFFLVFLAVVVVGAAAVLAIATLRGGRAVAGLAETVPNLPPVLLPENASASDVDAVRFALSLRGYRMDQVDQVLDELRDQISAKDAEIAGLKQALETAGTRGEGAGA
jgi:DivIVA domain-containing protein